MSFHPPPTFVLMKVRCMVFLNTFGNSVNEVMSTTATRKRVVVVGSSYGHRTFLGKQYGPLLQCDSFESLEVEKQPLSFTRLSIFLQKKKCLFQKSFQKLYSVRVGRILYLRQGWKSIHLYNQGEGTRRIVVADPSPCGHLAGARLDLQAGLPQSQWVCNSKLLHNLINRRKFVALFSFTSVLPVILWHS